MLFINLLTDSLPALAIGMEPADDKLLEEKPRDPKVGIMTKDFTIYNEEWIISPINDVGKAGQLHEKKRKEKKKERN